ncbi:imidazole glycerol phosphate synthase subunit HisH [Candidatus Nasuia deltocephalinicola]|uniref:imidazole glycerol phosphate synthase subunit HisH n=1 Tax=Candidatus Nasuia deltocephalincola TaxID=1160784 RepID=UPI00216B4F2D|nr:imidazole glycerol phosphate synthase subunit HisH [Candidatus Nasuia deltocephalinicola]
MLNIGIFNFGSGNLKSIIQILNNLPLNLNLYIINKNFNNLEKLNKVIIPGQGNPYGLVKEFLKFDFIKIKNLFNNIKIFGICIGKQIFYKKSSELNTRCLNYLEGHVNSFNFKNNKKIPNIGWNRVYIIKKHKLLNGIKNNDFFYFSHTYYIINKNYKFIQSISKYNIFYPSIFIKNNLFLVQFHPEKSFKKGYKIFYNFCNW